MRTYIKDKRSWAIKKQKKEEKILVTPGGGGMADVVFQGWQDFDNLDLASRDQCCWSGSLSAQISDPDPSSSQTKVRIWIPITIRKQNLRRILSWYSWIRILNRIPKMLPMESGSWTGSQKYYQWDPDLDLCGGKEPHSSEIVLANSFTTFLLFTCSSFST